MKKGVKSQVALEFLTTYAWAFLVIIVTIGALYYFGIFDFSKFVPQKCIFPSQFECLDFTLSGDDPYGEADDVIKFKLINNIGEDIVVDEVTITDDSADSLECTPTNPATPSDWSEGDEKDFKFENCHKGVFITGQRTDVKITIKFCAPATTNCESSCSTAGCPIHTINGRIYALVSST